MKTAADYPVSFGYKAQDGIYYADRPHPDYSHLYIGKYHRGSDRAMPENTPVVIGDTTIGLSGNTGMTGGPHLHIQAMKSSDINPAPYEFKPGVVQEVGYMSDFGNYVSILVDGVKVYYAHLNQIKVKVGQRIKGKEKLVLEEQPPVFDARYYLNKNPDVNRKYKVPNAVEHWLQFGIKEGRPSAPNFHVKEYLANYADLRKAYGDKGYAKAVKHYYNHGINEGRSGLKRNPIVNTAQATLDKIKEIISRS